jgi:hypothetical protein
MFGTALKVGTPKTTLPKDVNIVSEEESLEVL